MISQVISTIPAAGKRGIDTRDAFVTKQEAFQDHLQLNTVSELNTYKDQANAVATEINTNLTTIYEPIQENITDVVAVGSNINNVNTVANSITNVNTVSTNIANVNTVAPKVTEIGVVSTNIANVNTVAPKVTEIGTVAGSIANVNTVATNIVNVNTVATNIVNVNTVATNIADVVAVADNMDEVINAAAFVTLISRADKYLAALNIAAMSYNVDGDLVKIQYDNPTDFDYEVLGYTSGNLTTISHYVGGVLKGTTTLSYTDGSLVSAIFVGV